MSDNTLLSCLANIIRLSYPCPASLSPIIQLNLVSGWAETTACLIVLALLSLLVSHYPTPQIKIVDCGPEHVRIKDPMSVSIRLSPPLPIVLRETSGFVYRFEV